MDGVRGRYEDHGGRGEDEEEGRAEEEKLHFGGGGDDDFTVAAATSASASALVTNPLPLEAALPTTSTFSTQGPLELTNPSSELTSLGKSSGCLHGSLCLTNLPA